MILGEKDRSTKIFWIVFLPQIIIALEIISSIFALGFEESSVFDIFKYGIMIYSSFSLLYQSFRCHQKINFFQLLFLIWIGYIIIAAFPELGDSANNHIKLKRFLSIYLFIYLIPLFMVIKPSLDAYRKILGLAFWFGITYFIICIPAFFQPKGSVLSEMATTFIEGSLIILMTAPYHKKKKTILITIAICLGIVIMLIFARRNKVVYFGGGLLLVVTILTFFSKLNSAKKFFIIIITVAAFILLFNISEFNFFFERMGTGMDSRRIVLDSYYADFNSTPSDWITGRGIFGEVAAGRFYTGEFLRDDIENGYLSLILKGGWIWLGLLIIISLNAIIKGLFHSNNLLCKGFALLIILYFIDMIGFGVPSQSLKYIMVYISIGGCNYPQLRAMTNSQISQIVHI